MLLNQTTALIGSKVILVPYRKEHVLPYHEWMSNEQLREQTASEVLTLEEEYEMQNSWRVDEDKLTFIILRRLPTVPTSLLSTSPSSFLALHPPSTTMLGDVNLFLTPSSPSPSSSPPHSPRPSSKAELELMIAAPTTRRQGFGSSALRIFMQYAKDELGLSDDQFFARIGIENGGSIGLFEKIGFGRGKVVEVFGEVEMVWKGGEGEGEGEREGEGFVKVEYPLEVE